MEEFLTWDKLLTFSGLVVATCTITSFIKECIKKRLPSVPIPIVSWMIASILLILANVVTFGMMPWHGWILAIVNAMTVSLTANGLHSVTKKKEP